VAPIETLGHFVRELTSAIADIADADQWVVVVDGVDGTGREVLSDLMPAWWFSALDGCGIAIHRVALPLKSGRRILGVVKLESWKPGGFRRNELDAARDAADSASRVLDMLVPKVAAPPEPSPLPSGWPTEFHPTFARAE
jgi:hypothetical protein